MPTRRAFCRAAGAAALGAAVVPTRAAADHFDARPSHVSITYDEPVLDRYKPHLAMSYDARQQLIGMYGWIASSPEYDTDVCVYWCSYTHQDGYGDRDSHYGDHEPVQVEVDSQTGDVTRVRASIYHWIKGEALAESVPMQGDNPQLRIIDPWHQYTAASSADSPQAFDVRDLTSEYQGWLDNGLEQDLVRGASTNPWIMRRESDFWRGRFFGVSLDAAYYRIGMALGRGTVGSLEA